MTGLLPKKLRQTMSKTFFLLLAAVVLGGCTVTTRTVTFMPELPPVVAIPGAAPAPTPVAKAASRDRSAIGQMLNAERAAHGLPPVTPSARLKRAAMGHARDMSVRNFFSHVGSDGRRLGQRVRAQGYSFCLVAENIAKGQTSLEEVVQGWMDSPGHRRNMLARGVTEYGFAHTADNVWVLDLGRPGCEGAILLP